MELQKSRLSDDAYTQPKQQSNFSKLSNDVHENIDRLSKAINMHITRIDFTLLPMEPKPTGNDKSPVEPIKSDFENSMQLIINRIKDLSRLVEDLESRCTL